MLSRPLPSPFKIATRILFVLLLAIILRTFGDYGMSWDQHYRLNEGGKKLNYYENILAGNYQRYQSREDLYPGFYDLLVQFVNSARPCGEGILGQIYTDHLLSALFGFLAVVAAWKIGKRLGGKNGDRVGFLSALFLISFPHFYGHIFINPKDIPFAAAYLWSLYYTLKVLDSPLKWKLILKLTVVYGITMGIRMGGVLFFGYFVLALVARLFLQRKELSHKEALARTVRYAGLAMGTFVGALAILLPFWPYAHPSPIWSIFHALSRLSNYPWNGPVVLNGVAYAATELPWYYMPEMLIITSPEFLVVLGFAGVALAVASFVKKIPSQKADYFTARRLSILAIAFCILFPLAVVIVKRATLYDGIRHFLFVLGPLAVLGALAFDRIFESLRHLKSPALRPFGRTAAVLFGGLLCFNILVIVRENILMHPYQYVYFNSFVGGTEKAWPRFDTEYWGTSHKEAVELLVAHLAREGDTKVYKVHSPMAPWLTEYFLPKNLTYTNNPREADFFISFLRYNAHMWSDGEVMEDCLVVRKGAIPLALVRDRRKITSDGSFYKNRPSARFVSGIMEMLKGI